MRRIVGLTLVLAVCAVVLLTAPAEAATSWTESWQNGLGNWTPITQSCTTLANGQATMTCQSAALRSVQAWDSRQPLAVKGDVSCRALVGVRYWCALVLWSREDDEVDEYASFHYTTVTGTTDRYEIMVATRAGSTNPNPNLGRYVPGEMHNLEIRWDPAVRRYSFLLDGVLRYSHPGRPMKTLRVETLVASVGEATPNDGSLAQGVYGPITVTSGVLGAAKRTDALLSLPTPTPTPTATMTPTPTRPLRPHR